MSVTNAQSNTDTQALQRSHRLRQRAQCDRSVHDTFVWSGGLRQQQPAEIVFSVAECPAGCQSGTSTRQDGDTVTVTTDRGAIPQRCWCCELCCSVLIPAYGGKHGCTVLCCTFTSPAATNVCMFKKRCKLVHMICSRLSLTENVEGLLHVIWWNKCQRSEAADICANFVIGFIFFTSTSTGSR